MFAVGYIVWVTVSISLEEGEAVTVTTAALLEAVLFTVGYTVCVVMFVVGYIVWVTVSISLEDGETITVTTAALLEELVFMYMVAVGTTWTNCVLPGGAVVGSPGLPAAGGPAVVDPSASYSVAGPAAAAEPLLETVVVPL